MKEYRFFSSITLIGFGLFHFLKSIQFAPLQPYYSWGTLLTILGIAFLCQAIFGGHTEHLLTGVLLTGIGLHPYMSGKYSFWPDETALLFILIAVGLLATAIKKGSQKGTGLLFLGISILFLFSDRILDTFGLGAYHIDANSRYWPLLLIGAGIFVLYKRK